MSNKVIYRNLGELVEEAKKKHKFKNTKGYKKRKNYCMDHPRSHIFSTGFYSVTKVKNRNYKQGFCYTYIFYDGKKRRQYSSVNLLKLKKKVLDNNKIWRITDRQKAMDTANYHNISIEQLL